ncbi:hypothetical protein [Epilithonimonas hispanica]|uniref:Uncharacterized protein n=1 Tax=Epilithonimonas hispanica TaxID=358687 RepID=A0A3D9CLK7_9FLAO|nr:hypothetical protein [Epilithonimonas hispanica]REC66607.1 hypothetical protein DRF58_16535 [Epilithonimonas hispanica]
METQKFELENHKIAVLIIVSSLMFLIYNLLTGTLSKSKTKELQKKIEIKKIMSEDEVNSVEAETIYYENHPNEKFE